MDPADDAHPQEGVGNQSDSAPYQDDAGQDELHMHHAERSIAPRAKNFVPTDSHGHEAGEAQAQSQKEGRAVASNYDQPLDDLALESPAQQL